MIRFLLRGCLWVFTAWCAGAALGAVILDNTADVIRYGMWAAASIVGIVASHLAHRQHRRVHGEES